MNDLCYIIAEIGVNHAGDADLAKKMVASAMDCGADAVKFQTFTASSLVTSGTPKVEYQNSTTSPDESHFEMIRGLEFSREGHQAVKEYCDDLNIDFVSTPYDVESARFLHEMGVEIYKTASADIVDLPLHETLAKIGKHVIIATGMASLGEVETALDIYRSYGNTNLTLLHCVSNYPCSDQSLNLNNLKTLKEAFQVNVGFSDHSLGYQAAMLSLALGAKVVEKHFTLDKNLPGPDHKASSDPTEFAELVTNIRRAEKMLGSRLKHCQEEERQMSRVSRKSITLNKPLIKGQVIKQDDLSMKRPGLGLKAIEMKNVVGKKLRRDLPENHLIKWTDLDE